MHTKFYGFAVTGSCNTCLEVMGFEHSGDTSITNGSRFILQHPAFSTEIPLCFPFHCNILEITPHLPT